MFKSSKASNFNAVYFVGGECDDPLVAMHYILTKCSWAKLLCLCKMEKEALSVSEKALHLSDGEWFNHECFNCY